MFLIILVDDLSTSLREAHCCYCHSFLHTCRYATEAHDMLRSLSTTAWVVACDEVVNREELMSNLPTERHPSISILHE